MYKSLSIFKRDLFSFFVSPAAYCVFTGLVLLSGFVFFSYLGNFNYSLIKYGSLPLESASAINLNQWVVERYLHTVAFFMVFVVPLLTMRAFAEERKQGTYELLLTSPLSTQAIVAGKFLALGFVLFVLCLCTAAFPLLLCLVADPEIPAIIGGVFGLLLYSFAFAAIAMAASAVSDNQIIAAVSSLVTLLLLYVMFSPARSLGSATGEFLKDLSPVWQLNLMVEGVVSVSGVCYFLSLLVFGLSACRHLLDLQRFR